MTALLEVRDVIAGYTPDAANPARHFNGRAGPVEIVTVLGPNGAGKSTLIKAIVRAGDG